MEAAVYRVVGDRAETRASAGGPWDPAMQHGAAPAALAVWAAERVEAPAPMRIARVTIDLMRPVPVADLGIKTEVIRRGRKIQLTSVTLSAGGSDVVRASVLRTRLDAPPLPSDVLHAPHGLPDPDSGVAPGGGFRATSPFLDGISSRPARQADQRLGPRALWFRAERPLIEGETTSPSMRAAMAADFCNGVSTVLDFGEWTFVNADVTLSLARPPAGDWILVDAETWLGPDGAGLARAKLGDAEGWFGHASQTVLIEHR